MDCPATPRRSIGFRGRTYLAYALMPEPPIFDWLADLNAWLSRSPGYFVGKPVLLDLSTVTLSNAAILHLVNELRTGGIRIVGLEGVEQSEVGSDLPPVLTGGRPATAAEPPEPAPRKEVLAPERDAASLLLESPVRSGQTVVFPHGDVTVLGSVGSGAEIVAGGSIHVYGTLRGRAFAGSAGNPQARIFCNRIEAELLSIGGFYRTADDIESRLRSQPTQAWLKDDIMYIAPLN